MKIYIFILATLISGCSGIKNLNSKLYNTVPKEYESIKMKVSGTNGFLPGRNISFGDYSAKKIKRSAIVEIQNEYPTRKSSFTQRHVNGMSAKVSFKEEFDEIIDIDQVSRLRLTIRGDIILENEEWEFYNIDYSGDLLATNSNGEQIWIYEVNGGYDFVVDEKIVAGFAKDVNQGAWKSLTDFAWIIEGLSPKKKLILASLITTTIYYE